MNSKLEELFENPQHFNFRFLDCSLVSLICLQELCVNCESPALLLYSKLKNNMMRLIKCLEAGSLAMEKMKRSFVGWDLKGAVLYVFSLDYFNGK